ncbi:MAG TPA: hypothetical protein PK669_11585 [Methanosarcina thermophila]|uniref:hypothetical protein n=1 Tax=Methanosarcina thermophila TaxID=2210 RepID=UPI000AE59557|nr:hypothetical protein [Methanosarcina thermophila]HOA69495.1 hypothetical protein [Methanosarcina thermophila]HOQ66524.1 hypothetical protein [Methanosarcina thermophila]HPT80605.1 hypothetical protein [Methanosarcina thermophila]HPZ20650.1 hypothetical protein [Methanosarcina thermophila]HQD95312.1 hypothetical protein [Methanosarcina thermophila]
MKIQKESSLLPEKMERITPVRSAMFGSPRNSSIGYECSKPVLKKIKIKGKKIGA